MNEAKLQDMREKLETACNLIREAQEVLDGAEITYSVEGNTIELDEGALELEINLAIDELTKVREWAISPEAPTPLASEPVDDSLGVDQTFSTLG